MAGTFLLRIKEAAMKESTSWYLFMFAGLIIFVLLGLHMITMHLEGFLAFFGATSEDVLKFE